MELTLAGETAGGKRPSIIKQWLLEAKIFLIGLTGSIVLRVLNKTLRWETIGLSGEERYWPHGKSRIIALWHGQQLLMPWIYLNGIRDRKTCGRFVALISQHADGRIMAKAIQMLGIDSVAGSSSRKGREAMFALIDRLKKGDHVAITPDGPKGPRCRLKSGIIRIAERSGASIYPASLAAEKCWTFRSWDQMILPKPFSKMVLIMGEGIHIPDRLQPDDVERYTKLVEDAMNDLCSRASAHSFSS